MVLCPMHILKPLNSGGLWLPVIIDAAADAEMADGEVKHGCGAKSDINGIDADRIEALDEGIMIIVRT